MRTVSIRLSIDTHFSDRYCRVSLSFPKKYHLTKELLFFFLNVRDWWFFYKEPFSLAVPTGNGKGAIFPGFELQPHRFYFQVNLMNKTALSVETFCN